ncbi:MAG: hypothetical protein ACRDOO_24080 [Actinomadura sp.]
MHLQIMMMTTRQVVIMTSDGDAIPDLIEGTGIDMAAHHMRPHVQHSRHRRNDDQTTDPPHEHATAAPPEQSTTNRN